MPNQMNCETCDHKKINRDPELHCYMFKEAPEGRCGQHTGFKEATKAFAGIIRGSIEAQLEQRRKMKSFARICLEGDDTKKTT